MDYQEDERLGKGNLRVYYVTRHIVMEIQFSWKRLNSINLIVSRFKIFLNTSLKYWVKMNREQGIVMWKCAQFLLHYIYCAINMR